MPYAETPHPENVELIEILSRHGFDRDTLGVLLLIPLIHVAWADGQVDPREREAIVAAAQRMGMMNPRAQRLLEGKLAARPSDVEVEADLELIALLLASVPDRLPVTVDDINDLATVIGEAAGGVFGLVFTLDGHERAALEQIRQRLSVQYDDSWGPTLKALRADWQIDDWVEADAPTHFDEVDVDDELLLTDPRAIDLYRAAIPIRGGLALGVADLRRVILNEAMEGKPWSREVAQLYLLIGQWLHAGLIADTGRFWCEPPHGRVYEAVANIRAQIGGEPMRLIAGEQIVFAPSETSPLPALIGVFKARAGSVRAEDYAEAMVGAEPEVVEARAMTDVAIEDLEVVSTSPVVYLLIDLSGSMAGERLERALNAVSRFVDGLDPASGIRVLARGFHSTVGPPLTPLNAAPSVATRHHLQQGLAKLEAGGTTALYAAVETALDDLLRLVEGATFPKTWLIVLSDGEDNVGLDRVVYRGQSGPDALFSRMRNFISCGALNYIPIAYGGHDAVLHLSLVAGDPTHVHVAYPASIASTFEEVLQQIAEAHP